RYSRPDEAWRAVAGGPGGSGSRWTGGASIRISSFRPTTCSAGRDISGRARATMLSSTRVRFRRISFSFGAGSDGSMISSTFCRGSMRNEPDGQMLAGDPLWYQDAIIYELHVRSFFDSNADGFGDFPGLIQKLDYLKDLGVTALWLLPFYPSPLRDDGYDIADYTDVNRIYGKLSDVRLRVKEAHRRG